MSDFLVELGAQPRARRFIQTLGLPLPLPEKLRRDNAPYRERDLEDRVVTVDSAPGSRVAAELARALTSRGATVWLRDAVGAEAQAFAAAGEGWSRPVRRLSEDEIPADSRSHGLIVDTTGYKTPGDLHRLWAALHPRLPALARGGRIVLIGNDHHEAPSAEAAAAARSLDGFVRSLAKEVGDKGVTANLIVVGKGAEDRIGATLGFLLSGRSAFITGQVYRLSKAVKAQAEVRVRPLDGKIAVVTGAARGIGEATALALAREGATVVCLDRPDDDALLSKVAQKIGGHAFLADVTDPTAGPRLAAFLTERFGGLDIVVHNAGITRDRTLAKMDAARWDLMIAVNLQALLSLQGALEPVMRPGGRIVALSSIAGIAGNRGQTNYSASKSGVIGLVETWSRSLAGKGVTVNAIAPGFIETRLTAAIPVAIREVARRLSALSQGGLPEDIAEAVVFLSTPGACGLTGQTLRVCGGSFVGA